MSKSGAGRIKVYCRIRPSPRLSSKVTFDDDAVPNFDDDGDRAKKGPSSLDIHIPRDERDGYVNNTREDYRFGFDAII